MSKGKNIKDIWEDKLKKMKVEIAKLLKDIKQIKDEIN